MKTKTLKIILGIVVALCLGCWILSIAVDRDYDRAYLVYEKWKLSHIGSAIQQLDYENKLTPDVLRMFGDMGTPTEQLAEQLGIDQASLIDNRGNRFSTQTREDAGFLFLLIRSGYKPPGGWFRANQEDIGIEIVIAISDGKLVQIRHLWDGN
jgi:hypothetical protein